MNIFILPDKRLIASNIFDEERWIEGAKINVSTGL